MIHFYPGMGATSSMYGESWRSLFEARFHDWPQWKNEKTIQDIALRLVKEHHIKAGDTVIGTSLGGIVACEIANHIKLERVVLIGSALNKKEINKVLSLLHPLVNLTPLSFIKMSAGKLPCELTKMFSHSDPAFIRNMSKAIFTWEGYKGEVPVSRIHGKRDYVIPLPEKTDHVVHGGHLIAMQHPLECIKYVKMMSIA